MLNMIIFTLGIDQNIINEHNHKMIQIIVENPIHILHEYTRCISHTKRHNRILIMTIPRPKSSLLNILRLHTNLMIPRPQINLAKHTSSNQLIHQIINPCKWHQELWFIPFYVKHLLEIWLPDLKGLTIELLFSTVKTMAIGRIVCVSISMLLIGTSEQLLLMVPFRSP